ncbi:MAG: cysteine--tRNA ligase [Parcubacteria group bacterium]|nr:cysteine--tRNA ligase [Parcubacteria group bacterium]
MEPYMKLYNTLTRKKQAFKPLKKGSARLYTCGPTVYHYAHIGNLRSYVFADVLERTLAFEGFAVKRVMNITDVGHLTSDADSGEDKVEREAKKEKKSVWDVSRFYADAFFRDCAELNIKKPSRVVRATDTVKDQIKLIQLLFKKGYAYETEQAVYFDISRCKAYGKLSGQSLEEKRVAARGEVVEDPDKRHPADFALWFKRAGRHKNHAMHWASPWGDGFPGWHIECSAISSKYLGQPFDIHTGGIDHIGTHHTNEIAQSEAAYGKPLAKVWMHNEYLVIDRAKMSKSKGAFITLADAKKRGFEPLAFRYLALTTHYRSQLHFSWESLGAAQRALQNLWEEITRTRTAKKSKSADSYLKKFKQRLSDDLDTPRALAVLWEAAKDPGLDQKSLLSFIKQADATLGLDLIKQSKRLAREQSSIPASIKERAEERWKLKKMKEFGKSDKIRLTLAKRGYEIQDQEQGYAIKRVKNQ